MNSDNDISSPSVNNCSLYTYTVGWLLLNVDTLIYLEEFGLRSGVVRKLARVNMLLDTRYYVH